MSIKSDAASLASRLAFAPLFLVSGFGKLFAPAATQAYIASAGLPAPALAYAVALAVELGVATAFLLGLFTRAMAAVLTIFTVATAIAFHANLRDPMQQVEFLKNLAIAGGFLSVFAYGSGRFSVDALLGRATGTRSTPLALA